MNLAVEQTLRSGEIIRRLRAFVARGEVARQSESIAKLIEEASGLALVGAKERGIKVLISMDPDLPEASVDRVQIQQVLLNLIRNAMEAMDGCAARELTIAASRTTDHVLVSVSRHRHRHPSRNRGQAVPALRHDEAGGHGNRPVGLPHHRRGAWRASVDGAEPRRRQRVSFHLADGLIQIKAGDRTP